MRKTKILITLGPATESPAMIRSMLERGVNLFRLNMSHAEHDWVRNIIKIIRNTTAEMGLEAAILMDLQGPAIRTGVLPAEVALTEGMKVEFRLEGTEPRQEISTTVNYPGLTEDVSVGDTLLVDNGVLLMSVDAVEPERVLCTVKTDGKLGSRRHINLPGVRVKLPALTEKDRRCIDLGVECAVDFVALSFARKAEHVTELKKLLADKGSAAHVIAKIEDQQAVTNIDELILASDVIMIARGDLGIEVYLEELPPLQRLIISRCAHFGSHVIVATHMLESMITNPVPTRAEVTDVANAVYEQADAVMLSGESSVGGYPLRCVEILDRVARRIEKEPLLADLRAHALRSTQEEQAVLAAVELANRLDGACLVVFTRGGNRGRLVSLERPNCPVFVFTPDQSVCRALQMARGVACFTLPFQDSAQDTVQRGLEELKTRGLVSPGTQVVLLSDQQDREGRVDDILLRQLT